MNFNNAMLGNFSFASQNVRSLNISTKNDITWEKIISITQCRCDFIMLSDIRLNSMKLKSAVHDIEKNFFSGDINYIIIRKIQAGG